VRRASAERARVCGEGRARAMDKVSRL